MSLRVIVPLGRRCPRCDSRAVQRSRRRGLVERVVLPLVAFRPYRCESCSHRFYEFAFRKRCFSAEEAGIPDAT